MHDSRLVVSRFFFEGHIEDGYAERGAVEPRYSGLMQSIGLTPASLKCVFSRASEPSGTSSRRTRGDPRLILVNSRTPDMMRALL